MLRAARQHSHWWWRFDLCWKRPTWCGDRGGATIRHLSATAQLSSESLRCNRDGRRTVPAHVLLRWEHRGNSTRLSSFSAVPIQVVATSSPCHTLRFVSTAIQQRRVLSREGDRSALRSEIRPSKGGLLSLRCSGYDGWLSNYPCQRGCDTGPDWAVLRDELLSAPEKGSPLFLEWGQVALRFKSRGPDQKKVRSSTDQGRCKIQPGNYKRIQREPKWSLTRG
jgi:hypothetical protein